MQILKVLSSPLELLSNTVSTDGRMNACETERDSDSRQEETGPRQKTKSSLVLTSSEDTMLKIFQGVRQVSLLRVQKLSDIPLCR